MPNPQEIPGIATELVEMSREYLRQETIEPAKQLGKQAGAGIGGALLIGIGAVCGVWAAYYGLQLLFPEGEWWVVLSRTITALLAAAAAGIVVWRMQLDDQ